jgi:hypothetical protein
MGLLNLGIDPGNAACTSGLSKTLYESLLAQPDNAIAGPQLRAFAYAFATALAPSLPQGGEGTLPAAATDAINAASTAAAEAQSAVALANYQAQQAAADAALANAALADIASDSKLTPAEKGAVLRDYKELVDGHAAIDAEANVFGVSTVAFDAAISSLQTYMAGLGSNLGVNDAAWSATTTDIDGAVFRAAFAGAYGARDTIENAISTAAKVLANAAQGTADGAASAAAAAASNATTALASLSDIANDNKLTPDEKSAVLRDIHDLYDAQAGIDAQAGTVSVSTTAYDAAITALLAYFGTLGLAIGSNELAWQTTTNNIDGAVFREKFTAAYSARTALLNAIATAIKGRADAAKTVADGAAAAASSAASAAATANAALADISSDGKLTPAEKRAVLSDAHDLLDAQAGTDSQADTFVVSRTAYDTALSALSTYLGTLSLTVGTNDAAWQATTTDIDGPTFRLKFGNAYAARTTLLNAIAAKAKSLADGAQGTANTAVANAATAQAAASAAATQAANANAALADIASDGKLTPGAEKQQALLDFKDLYGNNWIIQAQANTYGIDHSALDAAVTSLYGYFQSNLGFTWGTTNETTWVNAATITITGQAFRDVFANAYAARTALLNAVASAAKGLIVTAQSTADAANGLASKKTATFFQATAPVNGAGGYTLRVGDVWFSTDTVTSCPDSNCKGHSPDANGNPQIGSLPHRSTFWSHQWTGANWIDAKGSQLLIASEISAGAITASAIKADALKTSNYQEADAAYLAAHPGLGWSVGDPVAGAKLDKAGAALKVAPGNLQVGSFVMSSMITQYFVRMSGTGSVVVTLGGTVPGSRYVAVAYVVGQYDATVFDPGTGVYVPALTGFAIARVSKTPTAVTVVATRTVDSASWVDLEVDVIRLP